MLANSREMLSSKSARVAERYALQDAYKEFLSSLFERIYVSIEFESHTSKRQPIFVDIVNIQRPPIADPDYDRIMEKNLEITSKAHAAYALVRLLDTHEDRIARATALFEGVVQRELSRLFTLQSQLWKSCIDLAGELGLELEDQHYYEAEQAEKGQRPFRKPRTVSLVAETPRTPSRATSAETETGVRKVVIYYDDPLSG